MAESAYTRGPWRADRDDDVVAPDGTGIASVHGEDADNQTANARLIAAAPDLVEALRPFAAVAEHDIGVDETDSDLFRPIRNNHAPLLTVGDMRRALAALRRALGQEG